MNENFTSLVFFTVLCQTAVGALIFRGMILFREGNGMVSFESGRFSLYAIALLLIISIAIAFLHLGKPFHAINALNNIGKSWLSREILSLSVLIASVVTFCIIITEKNSPGIEPVFLIISSIAGISLLYSMIRLYMIPIVPAWNTFFTPVSFIITTFVCGLSFFMMLDHSNYESYSSPLIIIAIIIISSIINSAIFPGSFARYNLNLFIVRTVLSILSISIIAVIFFNPKMNKMHILWVFMLIMIISSEIVNRYIFFLSFEKAGL